MRPAFVGRHGPNIDGSAHGFDNAWLSLSGPAQSRLDGLGCLGGAAHSRLRVLKRDWNLWVPSRGALAGCISNTVTTGSLKRHLQSCEAFQGELHLHDMRVSRLVRACMAVCVRARMAVWVQF